MKTILTFFITVTMLLFLTACGGGGGGDGDSTPPKTSLLGEVVYGPTQGIDYICSSGLVGTTNSLADFTCNDGDNVSFYLGSVLVATLDAKSGITTPYEFFPNNVIAALNYSRLLQALDTDGLNTYGDIVLDETLLALLPSDLDFSDPNFEPIVEHLLGVNLITLTQAQQNLNQAILDAGGSAPSNNAPIADAGIGASVTIGTLVTLDASASNDADGDSLTYSWSISSDPAGGTTLSDATAIQPSFTATVLGVYTFDLVVNDGSLDSVVHSVRISATTPNTAPVASAGPDDTAYTGNSVSLDGSGSFDTNGDTLSYAWTITANPGGISLSDPSVVNPSFTPMSTGTYSFELVVNDGTINSTVADAVSISISTFVFNVAPTANAGLDQNIDTSSIVTLNGSLSSDTNGDAITYSWVFISNPGGATLSDATLVNPEFTPTVDGTYVLELTVHDGLLSSVVDSVSIVATPVNVAPSANAGIDQNVQVNTTNVALNGSASSDANGDVITYAWSISSDPAGGTVLLNPATVSPVFTPTVSGTYVFSLVVNDGLLSSVVDTVSVVVVPGNSAPTSDAGEDQYVNTGDVVSLDASLSNDADLDAITYLWSISTEPVGSAISLSDVSLVTPSFTATHVGTYEFNLIVNDGTVASVVDTIVVKVIDFHALKKTGQTNLFVNFDDGYYEKGLIPIYTREVVSQFVFFPFPHYVDVEETVADSATGLMWQDNGNVGSTTVQGTQAGGYCQALDMAGHQDWRLPTLSELLNIADRSSYSSALNSTFQNQGDSGNIFWSSSTTSIANQQRVVDFYYGSELIKGDTDSYYVRCVRGTNTTNEHLLHRDNVEQVVIDTKTKLVWQDNENPSAKIWNNAINYCESLTLNGSTLWRLPNYNELLSIVDYESDTTNADVFIYNTGDRWTSTTNNGIFTAAFSIRFTIDSSDAHGINKNTVQSLKCVMDLP